MKTVLFSKGTTGQPKPVVYTKEDWEKMKEGTKMFSKAFNNETGLAYITLPKSAHLGYEISRLWCEETGNPFIDADLRYFSTEKIVQLSKAFPPVLFLGIATNTLEILQNKEFNKEKLKHVILAWACPKEMRDKIRELCKPAKLLMTYGFTEAKMAWITCDDVEQGYHVPFGDLKLSNEGTIVFNGADSGDKATIIEEKCSNCGFEGKRISTDVRRSQSDLSGCVARRGI